MNTRRHALLIINVLVLPLLLFHFQNCGSKGGSSGVNSSGSNGGQASIIENFNQSQVQFVSQAVQVKDDAPATGIDGFCNSQYDGAELNWSVSADETNSTAIISGTSSCKSGTFVVDVSQMEDLVCGLDHQLVLQTPEGIKASTQLVRRCQPLASQVISAPEGSPLGTTCSLEYSPAIAAGGAGSSAGSPCTQVCYRDNKVVLEEPQDLSQCSTLAATLAGP